jgi:hypothetical protein
VIRKLTQKEIDAFFLKLGDAQSPDVELDFYEPTKEETKLCKELVSIGVLDAMPKLPPPVLRAADPGDEERWMLLDILHRTKTLAHFDAESGLFPVPYGELLQESLIPIASSLGRVVAGVGRKLEGEQCTYKIALVTKDAGVATAFTESSDYFHVPALIELWNQLFEAKSSHKRFMEIESEDQTALILCATPKAAKALAVKHGLEISLARDR